MSTPNAAPQHRPKGQIDRQVLISAALKLLGPNRSVSTLGLREVAREAGIAPNSFYRHFRDIDELIVALIDQAGVTLRVIIREARGRIRENSSVIVSSVDAFMEQLEADEKHLHVLLREGTAGSTSYRQAVERELQHFEDELKEDLIRISSAAGAPFREPALVSRALTRMIFTWGGMAMDQSPEQRKQTAKEMVGIIRMIISGASKG